jgi:hypothetical protein
MLDNMPRKKFLDERSANAPRPMRRSCGRPSANSTSGTGAPATCSEVLGSFSVAMAVAFVLLFFRGRSTKTRSTN